MQKRGRIPQRITKHYKSRNMSKQHLGFASGSSLIPFSRAGLLRSRLCYGLAKHGRRSETGLRCRNFLMASKVGNISSDDLANKELGEVFLVGTGPGDPRMLTLGALELLKSADVVLYDRLVSEDILSFIDNEAEKICVGKGRGIGTGSQRSIQDQLAFHVNRGKRVVRLKGGDPAIFGRMGDEVCYLREKHDIEAVVIPGVTAASGVAARLGFPLTHSGVAESVRFFTGHIGASSQFEIGQVEEGTTLVIYMGLRELPRIVEQLLKRGASRHLPAVAVQSGTTLEQRTVWGTLETLADKVAHRGLTSPTLIVIGEVVRMGQEWKLET